MSSSFAASRPAPTTALVPFDLFPTFPLELQNKVWVKAAHHPHIIILRLTNNGWKFFAKTRPVFLTSHNAQTETQKELTRIPQSSQPILPQPLIFVDYLNDILYLQLSEQWFREPEELPAEEEDEDDDRVFFPAGGPVPASECTELVRNIAVNLSLRPFDFPPNQEDDEPNDIDPSEDEGPFTNIERWTKKEVRADWAFLDSMVEQILKAFANVKKVYLVVPAQEQPASTHYDFNGFQYPRVGVKSFLPWDEVADGELIYTHKVLRLIEENMGLWANDNIRRRKRIWRNMGKNPSDLPKLELVVADYEGRGHTIE